MSLRPVNGVQLDVEESGAGDPLILVHGSWDDRETWRLAEDRLGESFRVISYSRRGHSASEDSAKAGTRRDDEDDLAALMETLGVVPAHVVANSFGSSVSLGLVARRPDLFRSLALHEPPLLALAADDPVLQQVGAGVGAVLELIERGENEAAARVFVNQVAIGPGAWEAMPPEDRAGMAANAPTFAGEMADPDWNVIDLDAVSRLDRPVLFTKGDQSPPFFAVIIDRLQQAIPGAQVQTIPGAGHVPHETHPTEYAAMVSEFLRGSSS